MKSRFYCITLQGHSQATAGGDATSAQSMQCADARRASARHALWDRMKSYPGVVPSQGKTALKTCMDSLYLGLFAKELPVCIACNL